MNLELRVQLRVETWRVEQIAETIASSQEAGEGDAETQPAGDTLASVNAAVMAEVARMRPRFEATRSEEEIQRMPAKKKSRQQQTSDTQATDVTDGRGSVDSAQM